MKHLYKEGLRRCYRCKEVKQLTEFRKRESESMGYDYICKKCPAYKGRKTRPRLVEKLGLKCKHCGIENSNVSFFDLDHIKPTRRHTLKNPRTGFIWKDEGNLQVLCPNCHRIKTIQDRANGFI